MSEHLLISVAGVSAGYGDRDVLADVELSVRAGELCVVLGPNGSGKSTLLKLIAGSLPARSGQVRICDRDLAKLDRRDIARMIAVVPQNVEVAFGFSVLDVVTMGRAPHQGAWMRATGKDEEVVKRAISSCFLEDLVDRPVSELSGGEQKRVAIARALAQEAEVLVLDEASAHLDVKHALMIHELIHREVRERGLACIAVLHDLNAAAQYADSVALLKDGKLVAHGPVEEVMTYRRLKDLFATELFVGVNELDQTRYFLPVRPNRESRPPKRRDL